MRRSKHIQRNINTKSRKKLGEFLKEKAYLCTYDTNVINIIVEYQQQNGRTCSSPASMTSDGK